MGQVIISGGGTYDVYGTESGFKVYMAGRIGVTAYDSATNANKQKALVSATRWLDRQKWQGAKTSSSQALEFPRTGLVDKYGDEVADDSVPTAVESACYELAYILLDDATKQDNADTGSNVKKVQAGSASVEFFVGSQGSGDIFPPQVLDLVRQFLDGYDTDLGAWASGYDVESQFDDDAYGLGQGMA